MVRRSWQAPSKAADAPLLSVLEQQAKRLLSTVQESESPADEVKRVLTERGVTRSLSDVAHELGVSPRTLQRRLQEAEAVFADLAADVRQLAAEEMLAQESVSIAEAAYLLGFSDQSSFTRAFKRWTERTPAAFRKEHRKFGEAGVIRPSS